MVKQFLLFLALAGVAMSAVRADNESLKATREVEAIARKIYATKLSENEYLSGQAEVFKKNCEYLRNLYAETLVKVDGKFCSVPARFPTLDSESIEELANQHRLPKSKLVSSTVTGDRAVVKVNAPIDKDLRNGRVVYFMKKTEQGWRIVNMLAYEEWPLQMPESKEAGPCPGPALGLPSFSLALPPTGPEMFEDVPSPCKEARIAAFNRNGWGKW